MKSNQLYSYVGPEEIIKRIDKKHIGQKIHNQKDIIEWINRTNQKIINNTTIATFIINENEELLINDRHSEHVMCAGGKKVFSAGEITFILEQETVYINEISNQSTGYCPQPSSWKTVKEVLLKIELDHPEYFTNAFEFRYCTNCKNINLIKEGIYECAICDSELDSSWNFDHII